MISFDKKNVLFITTKNLDYIRNAQEITMIEEQCKSLKIIGSNHSNYIKRIVFVYLKVLCSSFKSFDIIFIGFAPQLIVPLFIYKLKSSYIIIDFFISIYDTFVFDRKNFKEGGLAAKILKKIDIITLLTADKVISDTKEHGKYFIEEFGLDINKLEVLYLKADTRIYNPCQQTKKPEKIRNKFVVLYFGSVLPLQGIECVLEALEILSKEKDIYFYMIGPISKKYNKPYSNNIEYIDWLTQDKLADYISFSDLCLAGHFNNEINKAKRTIPGKAYIYHHMGKPMILGDNKANREIFDESMEGIFLAEMGNPNELANKIKEIKSLKDIKHE